MHRHDLGRPSPSLAGEARCTACMPICGSPTRQKIEKRSQKACKMHVKQRSTEPGGRVHSQPHFRLHGRGPQRSGAIQTQDYNPTWQKRQSHERARRVCTRQRNVSMEGGNLEIESVKHPYNGCTTCNIHDNVGSVIEPSMNFCM